MDISARSARPLFRENRITSFIRNELDESLFFQNADELADKELVAGFEAESYYAATSVVAFPAAPDSELQSPLWDDVLSQGLAADLAVHLQGCPTHGNVYSDSCLSCSIWQESEQALPRQQMCREEVWPAEHVDSATAGPIVPLVPDNAIGQSVQPSCHFSPLGASKGGPGGKDNAELPSVEDAMVSSGSQNNEQKDTLERRERRGRYNGLSYS